MPPAFSERLAQVQAQVADAARAAGRQADEVKLVAVTKTASDRDLHEAVDAGQQLYAHNRVQALAAQHEVLPQADWHLIGPLQRNKARRAVGLVSCIESLADLKLATALDRLALELRPTRLPVLVQVNLHPEDGRAGLPATELAAFLGQLTDFQGLEVRGLMTIAAAAATPDQLRRHFSTVRDLAEAATQDGLLPSHPELSMGMSNDFPIAIAEGATLVRVGRALFPADPS